MIVPDFPDLQYLRILKPPFRITYITNGWSKTIIAGHWLLVDDIDYSSISFTIHSGIDYSLTSYWLPIDFSMIIPMLVQVIMLHNHSKFPAYFSVSSDFPVIGLCRE